MINLDLVFALVFYGLIFLYFITHRNKFEVQWKIFVLYKTKIGLNLMDRISKIFPKFWEYLGYLGVVVGYLGMVVILYTLILGTYRLIFIPDAIPAVAPLLPGIQIPGLPVITFWHWILAILVLAVVHEFSHGLYARLYNIKVKSSGFAFLGPVLAAFVEPDEQQMEKASKMKQLSIFAAGPFSNILLGIAVFFVYALFLVPIASSINESVGVEVVLVQDGFPASNSGMTAGEKIISINGNEVKNIEEFRSYLDDFKPGDNLIIETDKDNYGIEAAENPNNKTLGYLGISVQSVNEIREDVKDTYGTFLPKVFMWFFFFFFWLYVANIGVGLFNLLPLGAVDGGKMFYLGALAIFKKKRIAMKLFKYMTLFVLLLIIINFLPWIFKLFSFLFGPLLFLFG